MAAIVYPAALPAPAGYPFMPRERRAASPQPGPTQLRGRSREQIVDVKGVRWVYSPAQMAAWRAWFEDTLQNGQLWFAVSLPGDGGWRTRVARYVGGTVRDSEGAGFFTVTADLEINGSRVPPQEGVPVPHICWATDPAAVGSGFPSATTCYSTPEAAIAADMDFLGGPAAGFIPGDCYETADGTFCTTYQVIPGVGTVQSENPMYPRWET